MDLRQLEYFLEVAERRSITAAAAELNITQPTLTKSIKLLEFELGVALFVRQPRGVELTPSGRSLVRHAQAVRVQVKDAKGEINGLRGGEVGVINIGAGPAWLRRHLPLAVARVLKKRPGTRVRIEGGFDDALLRALRHGELDFVVAELPTEETAKDLLATPLTSDALGVCGRAGHPLAGKQRIPMSALLDYPWIMPPRATRAQRRLQALFVANDLPPPEAAVETQSMAFLIAALEHVDALTYAVATTLQFTKSGTLTMLDVPALSATRRAGVIRRRDGWLSATSQAIISELKVISDLDPQN